MEDLNIKVDRKLKVMGLDESGGFLSGKTPMRKGSRKVKKIDVIDSSSDSPDEEIELKSKSRTKSGIQSKPSDKVKIQLLWSHATLQHELVNASVKFVDLDLKLFIAGELEIITNDDISEIEKAGRLSLLKKITYYSKIYSWKGFLNFYVALLREIELGQKT